MTTLAERTVQYIPAPAMGPDASTFTQHLEAARKRPRPLVPPFDVLDEDVARDLGERWSRPCQEAFEYLAVHAPESLLALVTSGRLAVADLTFAAEVAGRVADGDRVRGALVPLLEHASAVVREGALYGLAHHLDGSTRERIQAIARRDSSVGVRTAAADLLDEG